jgi:hypothetical protein
LRIWNLPCADLDDQHLLGEHAELHGLWTIITQARTGGYANHPETKRWRGRLGALYRRHEEQVSEMARRGFTGHKSPLDPALIGDDGWEGPSVTSDEVARDRVDLRAHVPGWRKRRSGPAGPREPQAASSGGSVLSDEADGG